MILNMTIACISALGVMGIAVHTQLEGEIRLIGPVGVLAVLSILINAGA